MTTQHTPTPWAAEQIGVSDAGPDGEDVFDIGPVDSCGEMRKRVATVAGTDADHIVRCVNAHEELVAALKRAELTLASLSSCSVEDTNVRRAWQVVRAALAQAEGAA